MWFVRGGGRGAWLGGWEGSVAGGGGDLGDFGGCVCVCVCVKVR